jgi:hypothetical protein
MFTVEKSVHEMKREIITNYQENQMLSNLEAIGNIFGLTVPGKLPVIVGKHG